MSNTAYIPLRSCVACRAKKEKRQLVRFFLASKQVHVDAKSKAPGRGAYTCADEACLHMAIKRKAFHRAFRQEVMVNAVTLLEEFKACLTQR